MIDNPIQQIERTQDAYAGNPEGLQQRANMSKELIDLLAMQALQSDLAAQKRNMAMQQQGNPQTVKDQLEEGLMGEYRQEAAKDLGVGPSEGDVVERAGIAGQQMAQNAQMPQGPQGPQGGGGIASQAGPVNLAGGGIVAFDNGSDGKGPVEAEETVSYTDMAAQFGSGVLEWAKENPVDAAILGISFVPVVGPALGAVGRGGLGAFRIGKKGYDMLKANPTAQSLATKAKDLAVGAVTKPKYKPGEANVFGKDYIPRGVGKGPRKYDPAKGLGIAGAAVTAKNLLSDDEEEVEETGIAGQPASTTTKLGPSAGGVDIPFDVNAGLALPPSMVPRQPNQPGVGVLRDGSLEDLAKPPTAVVPPAAPAPAIDPDAGIKAALEKSANLDPVAQAKARSEAVKKDLGLAEGIATLEDRQKRRETAYKETTASGMDNLIDLLTAGGRGGITGVGARSGQLRREENARRMAYEDTLDGIEDKTMTLRSTIGGKAATSYDNTMKTALAIQQGAQTSLLTLSASKQKAIREERANNLAEARNDLSRENLLLNTVEGVEKQQEIITDTQQTVAEDFNLRYDSELRKAMTAVREGEDNAEEELKILQNRISLEMRNDPRWVTSEVRQEMIDGIAERNTALIKAQRERLGGSAISGDAGRLITAKKDG